MNGESNPIAKVDELFTINSMCKVIAATEQKFVVNRENFYHYKKRYPIIIE